MSPTGVHLDPGGAVHTVELRNDGGKDAVVQIEAFEWLDSPDIDRLTPTRELVAAPPVFQFRPGETQLIRVALRRPLEGNTERAYRLVITEVPDEVGGNGVALALRLSLPVFVTPAGAEPAPVWTVRRVDKHAAELVLVNRGSAHLRVSSIRLTDDGKSSLLLDTETHAYVLPGLEHSWRFEVGPGRLPPSLRVSANTNRGELEASAAVEGG